MYLKPIDAKIRPQIIQVDDHVILFSVDSEYVEKAVADAELERFGRAIVVGSVSWPLAPYLIDDDSLNLALETVDVVDVVADVVVDVVADVAAYVAAVADDAVDALELDATVAEFAGKLAAAKRM